MLLMEAIKQTDVECVSGSEETDSPNLFEERVRRACRDRCSNCGNQDRTRVQMIVPAEAGGRYVASNGALLCRSCSMAQEAAMQNGRGENRRIFNFWVSRKLYDRIQSGVAKCSGFNSMGALVRYLMSKYVVDEGRFDDLEQYQDSGSDVKINVWVEVDTYKVFKELIDRRGMTVTDGVKALILTFESAAEPLVQKGDLNE